MVIPLEVKKASWQKRARTSILKLQEDFRVAVERARSLSPGKRKRDDDYVPERLKHAERPRPTVDRTLQLVFAVWFLLPIVAFALLDPAGLAAARAWAVASVTSAPACLAAPAFWAAVACLSVERACYTWVWCYPDSFRAFRGRVKGTPLFRAGDSPVDTIVHLFKVNKFFQLLGFALLYFAPLGPGAAAPEHVFPVAVGLSVAALGQALNVGIYNAIGKNGVYYGYKFGIDVPWCTGFPFNIGLAHPQYLGSVLTAYGVVLATCSDDHAASGYGGLAHAQALLYAYMSYVEHNL